MIAADLIIDNINQLVTNTPGLPGAIEDHAPSGDSWRELGVFEGAAVAIRAGQVVWLGPMAELEQQVDASGARHIDAGGRAVVPGLVDCHTHVVYAGQRIDEFAMRCQGATYEDIAKAGGGIKSSMAAVRQASTEQLVSESLPRLAKMLQRGVTTAEIKSGYGLSVSAELAMLRAIAMLRMITPQRLVATLLAAHSMPPEYVDARDEYLQVVCETIIPQVAERQLAEFCDVFVERGAYTHDEARQVAVAAKQHGLGLRLHVDQLTAGQGAQLAAELGAVSADHLEHTGREGARALARADVIATILPICPAYLGKGPFPDGELLVDNGCKVAVSTDCNPGSAVCDDLWLAATLAATKCGLTLPQAFLGVTRYAADALARPTAGRLASGLPADLVVLAGSDWREPLYHMAATAPHLVMVEGEVVAGQTGVSWGGHQ